MQRSEEVTTINESLKKACKWEVGKTEHGKLFQRREAMGMKKLECGTVRVLIVASGVGWFVREDLMGTFLSQRLRSSGS